MIPTSHRTFFESGIFKEKKDLEMTLASFFTPHRRQKGPGCQSSRLCSAVRKPADSRIRNLPKLKTSSERAWLDRIRGLHMSQSVDVKFAKRFFKFLQMIAERKKYKVFLETGASCHLKEEEAMKVQPMYSDRVQSPSS